MGILTWVAFGLIVGIVVNILDPRPSSDGLLGTVILGILGAVLGGLLGDLVFGTTVSRFNISSLVVSLAGALLLLVLSKTLRQV